MCLQKYMIAYLIVETGGKFCHNFAQSEATVTHKTQKGAICDIVVNLFQVPLVGVFSFEPHRLQLRGCIRFCTPRSYCNILKQ